MEVFAGMLPGITEMANVHPLFVHFPIALLNGFLLMELLGAITDKRSLRSAATWMLYLGTLGAVVTVITGLIAESGVGHGAGVHELMLNKEQGRTLYPCRYNGRNHGRRSRQRRPDGLQIRRLSKGRTADGRGRRTRPRRQQRARREGRDGGNGRSPRRRRLNSARALIPVIRCSRTPRDHGRVHADVNSGYSH